jgi:hypothetical protein
LEYSKIFWIALFVLNTLGWNRPIQVIWDSFYFALTMAPSIAATVLGYKVWRRQTARHGLMTAYLLIWVISGIISAWLIFAWFTEVLLDPHGHWCPL